MRIRTLRPNGLSVIEVVIIIAALAIVGSLLIPAMPHPSKRLAARIQCTSNLKQAGLAFRLWADDHDGQYPQASLNSSGSLSFAHSPQMFRHYLVMSNELVRPKVLICPKDEKRTKAADFSKFSNANLSYFVGLDAHPLYPNGFLSGDRNISGGVLSNGFLRVLTTNSEASWGKDMHQLAGNAGLADGSVQQFTPARLRQHLTALTNQETRLVIP